MTRVVIVGKTKMKWQRCIGALGENDGRSFRLLTSDGDNFPEDTEFNLGQVWDLDLEEVSNSTPPHTEDIRILRQRLVRTLSMPQLKDFVWSRVAVPVVHPQQLFDGRLRFSQGKRAFVWPGNGAPQYSTGFCRFDKSLHLYQDYGKTRYAYCDNDISCDLEDDDLRLDVAYVGCESPVHKIPAGTVLRFSLARWENKPCYLMLSGWLL